MIYLILAFCSSALISIVMRLGEGRIQNNISTLAVNYLICLLLSMVYSAGSGSFIVPLGGGGAETAGGIGSAATAGGALIPVGSGEMTILLGLISGVCYFGAFSLYQYNIFRNGVLMSATFMKLGVLVPTMVAIVVFGERPGALQVLGICMALAAVLIVNGVGPIKHGKTADDTDAESADSSGSSSDAQKDLAGSNHALNAESASTVTAPLALIMLLLVGGSGDAMSKIYEELGSPAFNSQYLLYTFAVALVICALTARIHGQGLTKGDVIFGALVGIPNFYSARFLLLSLSHVPAVIAYPVFSVGTIVLVGAVGVLAFHEKMTRRQWCAVAMIVLAMVLLNSQG